MPKLARIAVCQLQCHPAVVIADRDLLCEPFPPRRLKPSLADLSRHRLDVSQIQEQCCERYTEWNSNRLSSVFEWLSRLDPFPDIIVLPECSVPLPDLHLLRTYAASHNCVIFAGTHTVRLRREDTRLYDSLNIKIAGKSGSIRKIQGLHVLPILVGEETHLHPKTAPSVFENTDTSAPDETLHRVSPITVSLRGQPVDLLPLVCSEALHVPSPEAPYDAVVIVARHDAPGGFDPIIRMNVSNKRPVILCNDGAFGGSGIHTVTDNRMLGVWWWSPPINGSLPPGDSILVADVVLDAQAVEHGVANPTRPASLIAVSPIVADGDKSGMYSVAQELTSIVGKDDNPVQLQLLESLQQQFNPNGLFKLTIPHAKQLARSGTLSPDNAQSLLSSCIVSGVPSIRMLEHELATVCAERVTQLSDSGLIDDTDALATIGRFRQECKLRHDDPASTRSSASTIPPSDAAIDRDAESRDVRQFLEHPRQNILCITGLDDVGKDTVVSIALRQTGHKNTLWLALSPDSTIGYIAAVLARTLRFPDDLISDVKAFVSLKNSDLLERIPIGTIVVISQADGLRDHGQWREPDSPSFLVELGRVLGARKGKLILTSTARLDLPSSDSNLTRRIYIEGLQPEYAKLLLDQQIRRVGLDPRSYTDAQRGDIVELLGGHPGAIIL